MTIDFLIPVPAFLATPTARNDIDAAVNGGQAAYAGYKLVTEVKTARKKINSVHPRIIKEQYERQQRVIDRMFAEGADDRSMRELLELQGKLGRLLTGSQRKSREIDEKKPFIHSPAEDYSKRFLAEARRMNGINVSKEMMFLLTDVRMNLSALRASNLERVAFATGGTTQGFNLLSSGTAAGGRCASALGVGVKVVSKVSDVAAVGKQIASIPNAFSSGALFTKAQEEEKQLKKVRDRAFPAIMDHVDADTHRALQEEVSLNLKVKRFQKATSAVSLGTTVVACGMGSVALVVPQAAAGLVPVYAVKIGNAAIEGKRQGVEDTVTGTRASLQARTRMDRHKVDEDVAAHGIEGAVRVSADRYDVYREAWAAHKMVSLLQNVLEKEESSGRTWTAKERHDALRRVIDPDRFFPGSKSLLKRTTAQASDIDLMNELLEAEFSIGALEGKRHDVRRNAVEVLKQHDGTGGTLEAFREQILTAWLKLLEPLKGTFSGVRSMLELAETYGVSSIEDDEVRHLRGVNPEADSRFTLATLEVVGPQLKHDSRYGRYRTFQQLGVLGMTREAMIEHARELGTTADGTES